MFYLDLIAIKIHMFLLDMNMDPFSYYKNTMIPKETVAGKALNNTAMSAYHLLKTVGVIGLTLSFIIAGIQLAVAKRGDRLEEAKKKILIKCVIGAAISAFVWIAGTILKIAKSMV